MNGIPEDILVSNPVFVGYRGSISHGTHIENSIDDVDLIGVFVAPEDHYIGLNKSKETIERKRDEWDAVYYEMRHFLTLLLKSNPNVLSTLWLPEKFVVHADRLWSLLVKNRRAFASKQAYPAFTGYAYSQLRRMTRQQEEEPEKLKIIRDIERELEYREHRGPKLPMFQNLELRDYSIQALRTLRNNLKSQKGYMGEKRKALTEQFGYDTKNAAHLVRILKQGIEFLETGEMQVEREDAEMLFSIKHGEWSLYAVQQMAETLFSRAETAKNKSKLPEAPDKGVANRLCMEMIRDAMEG